MKNNKGFIATSLILTFFLLFCALLLNTIRNYNFNQNLINKLDDIKFEETENDKKCSDETKIWNFTYTGDYQTFTSDCTGNFTIELWGANGGNTTTGGLKGYTRGTIRLKEGTTLYIYVGEKGSTTTEQKGMPATFNGGGAGGDPGSTDAASYIGGASGGGATDVRLVSGSWDNQDSLRSRIMVAGGGGGLNAVSYGYGGGLEGYKGSVTSNGNHVSQLVDELGGKKGTQTAGGSFKDKTGINNKETIDGSFGKGGAGDKGGDSNGKCRGEGGGGGGYYGGSGGRNASGNCYDVGGGGGSSYISGHTGCVAITSATNEAPKSGCTQGTTDNSCSIHYSKKKFTNTVMIDGSGHAWSNEKESLVAVPKPTESDYIVGYGYAKITLNYK